MSWLQMYTLTLCVGFRRRDVSDLEMLFLEVDWVIFELLSSATPSRPAVMKICQCRGKSCWKCSILISCVGFRKIDGSDLEVLVLDVDLVISEIPPYSTSVPGRKFDTDGIYGQYFQ